MSIDHFDQLQRALFSLRAERPRTRLIAVYLATFSQLVDKKDPWLIGRRFSLRAAADWLGWHIQDVVDAIVDLAEQEVIHLDRIVDDFVHFVYVEDDRLLATFESDHFEPKKLQPSPFEYKKKRSIYVITADEQTSKIGIAFEPQKRLSNLQIGSPLKRLTLAYVVEVPASAAHRVERLAHDLLAEHAIGQEWFRVPVQEAIDTVIAAIAADEGIAAGAAS